jgi:hypothetical protein
MGLAVEMASRSDSDCFGSYTEKLVKEHRHLLAFDTTLTVFGHDAGLTLNFPSLHLNLDVSSARRPSGDRTIRKMTGNVGREGGTNGPRAPRRASIGQIDEGGASAAEPLNCGGLCGDEIAVR